jgi:LPS-assembly lipoprotein
MAARGLLLLLLLTLAGCGFQLRGATPLPEAMSKTLIKGADNTPLYYELENAIRASGGEVVELAEEASGQLTIHSQRIGSRVAGTDPRGRVSEYEYQLQLVFSLQDTEQQMIAERESVQLQRNLRVNPDQVLSMGEEQAMLHEEMRRQAVMQMMRRLHALAAQ